MSKKIIIGWAYHSWEQYIKLHSHKKYVKRLNKLIKDIYRNGCNKGIGKPEPLRHIQSKQGWKAWSRRITKKDRLVYFSKNNHIYISSCRYHYQRK